jgi:hypothetical protein
MDAEFFHQKQNIQGAAEVIGIIFKGLLTDSPTAL